MEINKEELVNSADTELLDSQIDQITDSFIEEHFLDNDEAEQLEMLVAKSMKLGELYERKKWQAKATPEGSDLRFEQEDDAVWVFSGDSHQGTEISHLITSHIDDYNEDDVRLICHYAANEIDRLRAKLAKATPEGFVLVPKVLPSEINDQVWDDYLTPQCVVNEDGFSFISCEDFDLDALYWTLLKAQEQSHDNSN